MAAQSPNGSDAAFGENPDSVPSDAELVSAVRRGDNSAYAELWTRHHLAVTRYARQFGSASAADDLVSEAFARLLRVLQAGGGPDMNVRPYLLTAIRRIRIDIATRYEKRVGLTSEDAELDRKSEPARGADTEALETLEAKTVWKAYNSLPERWKTVLWHTLVEEQQPAEVAPILGSTPNAVAALSMRAREGLRQAFLQAHVAEADRSECQKVLKRLGAWERRALSTREAASIEEHLADCDRCTAAALEVGDLNRSMRVIVLPILLGGTALALKYLSSLGAQGAVAAGAATVSTGVGSGGAGSSAGGSAAGGSHSAAHAVLTKVVHVTTHLAPKSLALAGTSVAVATGALAMVAITQPGGGNHPVALPDPVASISSLSTSASSPVPSAIPTRPGEPRKSVAAPHPSASNSTDSAAPPSSAVSIASSPSTTRVVTIVPRVRHTTVTPTPTAKSSTTAPSAQPSASPTSSAPPSSSPPSSSAPSSSPSTTPPLSDPIIDPPAIELQIPFSYPGATTGGVGTLTISGPSDWTISSLTGTDPDVCQVTGPATATCTIAPTAIEKQDRLFQLVISSPHPTTGDIAVITYDDGTGLTSRTLPLD